MIETVLNNSSLQNPVIQNLDKQLLELQQVLMTSLQNLQNAVNLKLTGLEEEIEEKQ